MAEDIKTSTLLEESNALYVVLNQYNNVYVPQVNARLQAFGLVEPFTIEQAQTLTIKQMGQLLEIIASFLSVIGKEIGSRTFEDNIMSSGYTDVAEAYADVPNRFTGQTADFIQTNFIKTAEAVAVLDGLISDVLIYDLLSKIINIKNKVAEVTPLMNEV